MKRMLTILWTLLVSGGYFPVSLAEGIPGIHPLQTDRLTITVGGYFPGIDGDIWADENESDKGTHIDLQDDLGMDDSDTLPSLGITWRLSERNRFMFEYFEVGTAGSHVLERAIEWEELDFSIGTKVKGNIDLGVLRAFYGYSFVKDEVKELGAGLGLHYLDADMSIRGNAFINETPVFNVERGVDDWAVLPNIGIYGNYAFSDKWVLLGRVDWISASIDKYQGGLWNVEAAIQYQLFRNFGLGLSYRYVAFDIEVDESDRDWGADVDFGGPLAFFTVNF